MRHALLKTVLVGFAIASTSCGSNTVLKADFRSDSVLSPPASVQQVGTVGVEPGDGTVQVIHQPAPGLGSESEKWIRIGFPATGNQSSIKCEFSRFYGLGEYTFTARLFIRDTASLVTVQFEPFGESLNNYHNFLHLDFLNSGNVRIDDGPTFGTYPTNKPFNLTVHLVITETLATARISLWGGEGATGSADVTIKPAFLDTAQSFGAVRFWMVFGAEGGQFFVDDIHVSRKAN